MTDVLAAYRAAILVEGPRVLGLMDREPGSPSLGCCDRLWWAWKFTDFPGPRYQEAVCVLAYLFATPFDGNAYHHNPNLLAWIGDALTFWATRQHHDGSFDEAYPFERSLAATAFTSFYVAEAIGFLGPSLPAPIRSATIAALDRAGRWLDRNDETHGILSNHLAAAAAALQHIAALSGEARYERRSRYFLDRILGRQSPEGWYEEYGGADPGYQTHGSFYLARCWQRTGDAQLLDSLARANRFLAHFVHPDGSLGGEYASRGTQTYYPAAFEILGPHDPAAAWIAERMRPSVWSAAAAGLRSVDPPNYFPCLNNLVFAALQPAAPGPTRDPTAPAGLSWFPEAGMARMRTAEYEAFCGVSKGGALKVFDRRRARLLASDSGWVGVLPNGRLVSSHYLDKGRKASVADQGIEVEGSFQRIGRPLLRPWRFIGFRGFSLTVGRLPAAARWLKRLLVRVLIYRRDAVALRHRRVIRFEEHAVQVQDELRGAVPLTSLSRAASFCSAHMGSARYFVPHELRPMPAEASAPVELSRLSQGISVQYSVRADPEPR